MNNKIEHVLICKKKLLQAKSPSKTNCVELAVRNYLEKNHAAILQ